MAKDYLGQDIKPGQRFIRAADKYFDRGVILEVRETTHHWESNVKIQSDSSGRPAKTLSKRLIVETAFNGKL